MGKTGETQSNENIQRIECEITHILVSSLGKFQRLIPNITCDIQQDKVALFDNILLFPNGDIAINPNSTIPKVQIENPYINMEHLQVIEISYDEDAEPNSSIMAINHMIIKATTPETYKALLKLGLNTYQHEKQESTFILTQKEIRLLINYKGGDIVNFLRSYCGIENNFDIITITHKSIPNCNYIKDNTLLDKFKQWQEKMQILGLYGDYVIAQGGRRMSDYKGASTNPVIPPVRGLNFTSQNKIIDKIVIPSSVCIIGYLPKSIKQLDLTRATSLYSSWGAKEIIKSEQTEYNKADKEPKITVPGLILKDLDTKLSINEIGSIDTNKKYHFTFNYLQLTHNSLNILDVAKTIRLINILNT